MSQTTALQQLRADIKESAILSKATKIIMLAFIDNKLEKERQDLINAHHDGQLDGSIKTPSLKAAEDYYNNTFGQ